MQFYITIFVQSQVLIQKRAFFLIDIRTKFEYLSWNSKFKH